MKPGRTGVKRILDATGHSIRGISACWDHEAAFRQDVVLSSILFITSFFLAQSIEQWLLLVLPLILILIVELLNSAVENAVDRIGTERHHLSGRAKDMGSAAVLFCWVVIGMSWITIAWENLT
jgi:diacylglycerol kinase (ATP)